ncbi:hypothetical protein JTB14_038182 [Gonioctena quinquepunctata]|nr:hypothetical protein JTB14_038182 [Gonioctena quinquepunctata]
MSRHLRSCLPVTSEHSKPQVVDIRNEKLLRQDSLKKSDDKYARVSSNQLVPGDRVVRNKDLWLPGTVPKAHDSPRSSIVKMDQKKYRSVEKVI